ncbi:DUF2255 family protein [Flavihumibacter solisilvae]|uniref:DUF2255 domain-containing protein n=1 Tax=Flavihumibacter solisilvae TaxID=1349421 RepID=A0A0C1L8I2_9BACT|nr:DUF2255 family protein [Flavihumibacter solisilvae]KIC95906.1 hypothetical protein OI18_03190 [Flavihumibacter solisilvae]
MNAKPKWTTEELGAISTADDLKISPLRDDGKTYGTPTWIWNVAVKGELYVRGYHGVKSRWYQAALKHPNGRIHAAGLVKDVIFEPVSPGTIQDLVNKAYQTKYKTNPFVPAMISEKAQAATIRILPAF